MRSLLRWHMFVPCFAGSSPLGYKHKNKLYPFMCAASLAHTCASEAAHKKSELVNNFYKHWLKSVKKKKNG